MSGDPTSRQAAREQRGFTLIEVIVVLAIIAGLSVVAYAVVMPAYASIQAAYQRDDIERQLLELPQRVRLGGYGGILTSRSGERLPDRAAIDVEGVSEAEKSVEGWRVLRLALPPGWRMRLAAPILYHFSGSCEGGEVLFTLPSVVLRYDLTAPLCRPIRRDAARS